MVPISQEDDGSDSDAQYDADSDIHSADLRLILEALAGIVSLWLLSEKKKILLEVMKEAQGQRAHRSSNLGMLASVLPHAGSATVRMKASLTE